MGILGTLHDRLVVRRRAEILSAWFSQLAPNGARVLDVGCGDGLLSSLIASKRSDLRVRGVDLLVREETFVPVERFDGKTIPYEDGAFEAVLFSDVLHHTDDPKALLLEARRVAAKCVLLKDHYRKGFAAGPRLRFMDWTGNARFGISLPYNYWTERQWQQAWEEVGLFPNKLITRLGLYPEPFDWIFGAQLHFITRLGKGPLIDPHLASCKARRG
jgi:SAM-dependent methyltransferase